MIINEESIYITAFFFSIFSNISQVNKYMHAKVSKWFFLFFQKKRKNFIKKFLLILYKI